MEKKYDVLEFYKIINELINLSKLEKTKEKFIDTDIIKDKSTLDKELMLMADLIDFYKFDDGFELTGLSNIQRYINSIELIGSYLNAEDLADLRKNLSVFRISKSRAKNVRDKYKTIWALFTDVEEVKEIEQFIGEAINDDGNLKDDASIGLRDVRRQKQNINANIKEKFDIDDKTFQRDIDFLRAFYTENINPEIEIKYDKKKKGYILKNNKDRFRNEEILAISKILLESRAFCKEELNELLRKLCLLSEEDDMKQVDVMIKNEKFNYVPLKHGKKLLDIMWELAKYITKQEIISISYTTKEGKSKVHRIKPVSIMFSEYYFYIVSFMADKFVEDGPTIFRIDRIKKLKGTGENFEVPYLERFEDGEFRKRVQFMLSGKLRTVKFEYTGILEVVQDRLPTAEVMEQSKMEDGTEKYVITAEVYGKGIDMWLKSQGDKVKVIGEKE